MELFVLIFVAIFLVSLISQILALQELKDSHMKEYEALSADKFILLPHVQFLVFCFFISFEYRHIWVGLRNKTVFLIASISLWMLFFYIVYLVYLL